MGAVLDGATNQPPHLNPGHLCNFEGIPHLKQPKGLEVGI